MFTELWTGVPDPLQWSRPRIPHQNLCMEQACQTLSGSGRADYPKPVYNRQAIYHHCWQGNYISSLSLYALYGIQAKTALQIQDGLSPKSAEGYNQDGSDYILTRTTTFGEELLVPCQRQRLTVAHL